jgi:hypothetical protein
MKKDHAQSGFYNSSPNRKKLANREFEFFLFFQNEVQDHGFYRRVNKNQTYHLDARILIFINLH